MPNVRHQNHSHIHGGSLAFTVHANSLVYTVLSYKSQVNSLYHKQQLLFESKFEQGKNPQKKSLGEKEERVIEE